MNNKKKTDPLWQFRLEDYSNNARKGVRLIAARKGLRGRWLAPDLLPAHVKDYFALELCEGVSLLSDFADMAALRAVAPGGSGQGEVSWKHFAAGEAQGEVTIETPSVESVARKVENRLPAFGAGDGTKWGVSDFYEEKEAAIRAALESGVDFTSGWYGSKKEIASGCITRVGKEVLCQASVSDDFDTEGLGSVTVPVGRKGVDRLFEAIQKGLDDAFAEAQENQKDNATVVLWSVRNAKGSWVETYLAPIGSGHEHDAPPGDSYHKWGWQGEGRLPAKVRAAFERFLAKDSVGSDEFKSGGFTFNATLA